MYKFMGWLNPTGNLIIESEDESATGQSGVSYNPGTEILQAAASYVENSGE